MSNIDKQALRERYSEKPAPKCHICGSVMTIQRAGAGSVVYGCTGRIDKDGEGYKFAEGRDFADDHYARSRVTDYGPGGDPDVLALLDELAFLDKRNAELNSTLERWAVDRAQSASELDDAEKRIAELEARDINIKQQAQALFEAIANPSDHYVPAYVRCLREALNGNSAGKGE
ncbi:ead/Ea22-like family protein [Enterobacter ludwigii]